VAVVEQQTKPDPYAQLTGAAFKISDDIDKQDRSAAQGIRARCRAGDITGPSCNLGDLNNHVQVNVVMLPAGSRAKAFREFCLRNPQGAPLVAHFPGSDAPAGLAKDLNMLTDLPKYNIYENGKVARQVSDATGLFDSFEAGFETFLLGCSFSWEDLL